MEKDNKIDKFNIRVYGIIIRDNKILALYENYVGEKMTKLPGGGLEFGEGTTECLERELMEELNIKVKNIRHFYTQEDFLLSKFRANEQLLTIYYMADFDEESKLTIKEESIDEIKWISIDENNNPFTLPIDRLVYGKLIDELK